MLNVGLIGAGRIASVHASSIERCPGVRLVAISDPVEQRASALATRYSARVEVSADQLIEADDVDAVVIASSTPTHCSLMLRGVRQGKPVYCEKPLAGSMDQARSAINELGADQRRVMMGFNRRYDRNHAAVEADLRLGRLGRIQTIMLSSRGTTAPPLEYLRASGGIFYDKMVHFFDLARWLTRDEPVDIAAMGSVIADPIFAEANDVDTAVVAIRMASGTLCQIENCRRTVYGFDDRIEVLGTGGLIESSRVTQGSVMRIFDDKIMHEGLPKSQQERNGPAFAACMAAFVAFATGSEDTVPTVRDAYVAQAMAEAATRAMSERRIVAMAEILNTSH